jgi:hypothetical protein
MNRSDGTVDTGMGTEGGPPYDAILAEIDKIKRRLHYMEDYDPEKLLALQAEIRELYQMIA